MENLSLPTDEQVERACALVARGVDRVWPEDVAVHEHIAWRASCRSTLVLLLNQDKILGEPTNTVRNFQDQVNAHCDAVDAKDKADKEAYLKE